MTLKERFIEEYESKNGDVKCIVVALLNPSGGIDVISTTTHLWEKYKFYIIGTDDYFVLRSNVMSRVVNYMII